MHRVHEKIAAYCYRGSVMCVYVYTRCVKYLLYINMSCTETDELIKIPFRMFTLQGTLGEARFPRGKGVFWGAPLYDAAFRQNSLTTC